ncbi:MAG TPA: putative sulfate exporter family transporter, partial [Cytophagales bacterium]
MTTQTATPPVSTPQAKKAALSEDWAVVALGFLIILLSLAGLALTVPAFGWSSLSELTGKVLAPANLGLIGLQFGLVYAVALLGAWLTGKRVSSFLRGFP